MNTSSPEIYHAPTLLYLLCTMSAIAFVLAAYGWFWQAMKRPEGAEHSFEYSIWRGQGITFLFVLIMSICVGVYDSYTSGRSLYIGAEISILMVYFTLSYLRSEKESRVRAVYGNVRMILFWGCACFLGWGITIGFGFSLAKILKIVSVVNRSDFDVMVIFITGLLWNVPILWMFQKILKDSDAREALDGRGFYKFLWPVLLAYTVLLIPLMMQEIVNSEKWHKMENAKVIRKV